MSGAIHHLASERLAERVEELGKQIRQRRKALKVKVTTAAEAASMSRVTWHRIEKGKATVTIAAWFNALAVLGFEFGIGVTANQSGKPGHDEEGESALTVPVLIHLPNYPQLQALAWQITGTDTLTARQALDVYQRNRRHINWPALQPHERRLIDGLGQIFGETDDV